MVVVGESVWGGVVWCLDVMLGGGGGGGALPSPLHTNHHKMLISRVRVWDSGFQVRVG